MRDVAKLLEMYKPLILGTYARFKPMLERSEDKKDLLSQITAIFTKLVYEYDPRRGVDFPYFIKRMVEVRTYHYVTKVLKQKNKEVFIDSFKNSDSIEELAEVMEELESVVDVQSWDDDFKLGKKQKQLFIGLVVHHKSLKQLAEEEGVDVSILHTRMHFLLKKLKQKAKEQAELEEQDY